jgi:signal transduction histidine kinase
VCGDGLIALTVFALIIVQVLRPNHWPGVPVARFTAVGMSIVGVACVALLFRRRWPRTVLVVAVACALANFTVDPSHGPVMLVVMVAMYSVTLKSSRRTALVIAAVAAVVLWSGNVALVHVNGVDPNSLLTVVGVGLAFALGDAMRNRRAYLAEVVDRARRAEESREQEARRRVAEERLRIARDLHDVVAHHIALINVQAGVGAHLLDADPEQARQALGHIRRASRTALDELSATVGLLRQPEDPAAPTDPTVGLARLDELIAALAGCGLRVDVDGPVAQLPTAVDVTAYRIVQEALTNVHKHAGTDSARLHFDVDAKAVRIVVEDDGAGASAVAGASAAAGTSAAAGASAVRGTSAVAGAGHGVLGMRERAAAVGGSLWAGPRSEGGFRVEATLPLPAMSYPNR